MLTRQALVDELEHDLEESAVTMPSTPTERLEAAIRLEPTGTVPVAPKIGYFAASYVGMTAQEFLFDPQKQREALVETFDRMGGWDIQTYSPAGPKTTAMTLYLKTRLPGVDLPPNLPAQIVEEPIMTVEDYDLVINKGYQAFLDELIQRVDPTLDSDGLRIHRKESQERTKAWVSIWEARGIPLLTSAGASGAFSRFSFARSAKEFLVDLHRRPEKVKESIAVATPAIIASAIARAKASGNPRVQIASSRESNAFLSPRQFEEFGFPLLTQTVDALIEADLTPVFHFDQDWTLNLPFLKAFPKKKCILELDSFTDIFKAKEVLGDHMCIFGDVPPVMLTLGTPEQVTAYCKKLIDRVAEGGGLILSSGCSVPIDAKPENIQAILDTARTYPHH